jgi:hypothetical protein
MMPHRLCGELELGGFTIEQMEQQKVSGSFVNKRYIKKVEVNSANAVFMYCLDYEF